MLLMKSAQQQQCKPSFVSALSYRVPLPVTEVLMFHGGDTYSICPRCDCTMEREYVGYCDRCGQRLSWELLDYARVVAAPRKK